MVHEEQKAGRMWLPSRVSRSVSHSLPLLDLPHLPCPSIARSQQRALAAAELPASRDPASTRLPSFGELHFPVKPCHQLTKRRKSS